jgi:hypothetical protein
VVIPSVVPARVLPSGSVGRDPTDGAEMDGAVPAHRVSVLAGSRMVGNPRHLTTGTMTVGSIEPATSFVW